MIVEQMLKNAPKPLLHIADVSGSALFQGDCLDIMPLIPYKEGRKRLMHVGERNIIYRYDF